MIKRKDWRDVQRIREEKLRALEERTTDDHREIIDDLTQEGVFDVARLVMECDLSPQQIAYIWDNKAVFASDPAAYMAAVLRKRSILGEEF